MACDTDRLRNGSRAQVNSLQSEPAPQSCQERFASVRETRPALNDPPVGINRNMHLTIPRDPPVFGNSDSIVGLSCRAKIYGNHSSATTVGLIPCRTIKDLLDLGESHALRNLLGVLACYGRPWPKTNI